MQCPPLLVCIPNESSQTMAGRGLRVAPLVLNEILNARMGGGFLMAPLSRKSEA